MAYYKGGQEIPGPLQTKEPVKMNYEVAFWNSDFALSDRDQDWFYDRGQEIQADLWAMAQAEAEAEADSEAQRQADRDEYRQAIHDNFEF